MDGMAKSLRRRLYKMRRQVPRIALKELPAGVGILTILILIEKHYVPLMKLASESVLHVPDSRNCSFRPETADHALAIPPSMAPWIDDNVKIDLDPLLATDEEILKMKKKKKKKKSRKRSKKRESGVGSRAETKESIYVKESTATNDATQFPWTVAVGKQMWPNNMINPIEENDKNRIGRTHCTGSILNMYWVITAAHCINSPWNSYTVTAGVACRPEHGGIKLRSAQVRRVKKWFLLTDPEVHWSEATKKSDYPVPVYVQDSKLPLQYDDWSDIALLRLQTPLDLTSDPARLKPVRLPSEDDCKRIKNNIWTRQGFTGKGSNDEDFDMTLAGWGFSDVTGTVSPDLFLEMAPTFLRSLVLPKPSYPRNLEQIKKDNPTRSDFFPAVYMSKYTEKAAAFITIFCDPKDFICVGTLSYTAGQSCNGDSGGGVIRIPKSRYRGGEGEPTLVGIIVARMLVSKKHRPANMKDNSKKWCGLGDTFWSTNICNHMDRIEEVLEADMRH